MAAPKQRKTKSRRNQRRMHQYLKTKNLTVCSNCNQKKLPHVVCKECGYYKGRKVLDVTRDLDKKEKKKKKKTEKKEEREKKPEAPTLEELSKKKF